MRKIDWDEVVYLYNNGLSMSEVSKRVGASIGSVRYILKKMGVEIRNNIISKEIREAVIRDYNNGLSKKTIAEKYGIGTTSVDRIIKNGIRKRWNNRRIFFDENYFEVIDSSDKAYFLGLIASDGWVNDIGYSISITLKYEDGYILRNFAEKLGIDWYDVIKLRKVKWNDSYQYFWKFTIYSKKMVDDLNNWGLHDRKSYDLKPPVGIPVEFLGDFWRGVFDGDGSVRIVKNNKGYSYLRVELAGTRDMVLGFRDFLGIGGHVRQTESGLWLFQGSVGQVEDKFVSVFEKLYGSDCDLFLRRKFVWFMEFGIDYIYGS